MGIISRIVNYLVGWQVTRRIRKNNPELYKFLCSDESRDPANYMEARRPEQ